MTIKRFAVLDKRNEDTILDECGFPDLRSIAEGLSFYVANDRLAFLFLDEEDEDLNWIFHPDAFTLTVYNHYTNKCIVVNAIDKKDVVVFINKGKYPNYEFYGIYRLIDGYYSEDGKVLCDTPLNFNLEHSDSLVSTKIF